MRGVYVTCFSKSFINFYKSSTKIGFHSYLRQNSTFENPLLVMNSIREYHSTVQVMAKAKAKAKKGKISAEDGDEQIEIQVNLPKIDDYDNQMEKRITRLRDEFLKLRCGRVNSDMFDHVLVDAHGTRMRVSEAGQVIVKGPTKVSISVFDPTVVTFVAKAITDCGQNLNPVVEGNNVEIVIPKPSKEVRDGLIKTASKSCEKTKAEVRQIRKQGLDAIKDLKSSVSEDDSRRLMKEFDALTEKKVGKIDQMYTDKEKEIAQS